MSATKKSIYGVFALLVLLAGVLGVRSAAGAGRHSRELTRAEMAALVGRQGNPMCTGCWLDTIAAKCNEADPCYCRTVAKGANPTCPAFSAEYQGFTTATRGRTIMKTGETPNTKVLSTSPKTCYISYPCLTGNAVAMKQCDMETEECTDDAVSQDCYACSRDLEATGAPIAISVDDCLVCPN